jgi:hypothetical protein
MPKTVKLCAWMLKHDSHGLVLDTLVFLPDGDRPETDGLWTRVPWMDGSLDLAKNEICGVFDPRSNEKVDGFATVTWRPEDVKSLRPRWSIPRCAAELAKIEKDIQDRLVERGWEVLQNLLPEK